MKPVKVFAITVYDIPSAWRTKYFLNLFRQKGYEVSIVQPVGMGFFDLLRGNFFSKNIIKDWKNKVKRFSDQNERVVDGFPIRNVPMLPGLQVAWATAPINNMLNERRLHKRILDYQPDLIFFTDQRFAPMIEKVRKELQRTKIFFDYCDTLWVVPGNKSVERMQRESILRSADFVTYNAIKQREKLPARDWAEVPNGIEYEKIIYETRKRKKQVVFLGLTAPYIRWDLIIGPAKVCPDWEFLLIGPAPKKLEAESPNIHVTGYLEEKVWSKMLLDAKVGIIPFATNNSLIPDAWPTKLVIYMAHGMEVISTSIESVKVKLPHDVFYCDSAEQVVSALKKIGDDDSPCEKNREIARQYDWKNGLMPVSKKLDSWFSLPTLH